MTTFATWRFRSSRSFSSSTLASTVISGLRASPITAVRSAPRARLTLSEAAILADGGVRFTIALTGGTPAVPAHVMKVEVVSAEGKPLATWDWQSLSALPASAIVNDFPYNRFKPGPYGLEAEWARKRSSRFPQWRTWHRQPPPPSCASPTWTAGRSPAASVRRECRCPSSSSSCARSMSVGRASCR